MIAFVYQAITDILTSIRADKFNTTSKTLSTLATRKGNILSVLNSTLDVFTDEYAFVIHDIRNPHIVVSGSSVCKIHLNRIEIGNAEYFYTTTDEECIVHNLSGTKYIGCDDSNIAKEIVEMAGKIRKEVGLATVRKFKRESDRTKKKVTANG